MSVNKRRKGKNGELELAGLINKNLGYPCLTRNLSQTRDGGYDLAVSSMDSLEAERLNQMAIEVKRHQCARPGDIRAWWKQAYRQAMESRKVPVLFYRADRENWKAMMPLARSLDWELHHSCITMELPLFIKILKEPDLVHMQ